jgi:hypothetical protein
MSLDTFNKLITSVLLLYAMIMVTWSFVVGRSLDMSSYSALLTPVLMHIVHLVSNKFEDKHGE